MKQTREFQRAMRRVMEESIRFNQVLGLRVVSFDPKAPQLRFDMRPELVGHYLYGRLHGGAISYLADNALTFAGGSVLGDSVTAEYKINYLRPATGVQALAPASEVMPDGQGGMALDAARSLAHYVCAAPAGAGAAREACEFVMRAQSVEYLAPARFDDLLQVFIRTRRIGRTSVTWTFSFGHDGREVARGRVVSVRCRIRPGAAPAGAMVRSQMLMELRLLSRNGEQLLLTLVIPLLLLKFSISRKLELSQPLWMSNTFRECRNPLFRKPCLMGYS